MKLETYKTIAEAVDCYGDLVLLAARELALELCKDEETAHGFDGLLDELNGTYEDDCRAMQCWDEEEEACTDDLLVDSVMGRANLHNALDAWDSMQDRETALLFLVQGMVQRSAGIAQ